MHLGGMWYGTGRIFLTKPKGTRTRVYIEELNTLPRVRCFSYYTPPVLLSNSGVEEAVLFWSGKFFNHAWTIFECMKSMHGFVNILCEAQSAC